MLSRVLADVYDRSKIHERECERERKEESREDKSTGESSRLLSVSPCSPSLPFPPSSSSSPTTAVQSHFFKSCLPLPPLLSPRLSPLLQNTSGPLELYLRAERDESVEERRKQSSSIRRWETNEQDSPAFVDIDTYTNNVSNQIRLALYIWTLFDFDSWLGFEAGAEGGRGGKGGRQRGASAELVRPGETRISTSPQLVSLSQFHVNEISLLFSTFPC